MRFCFSNLIQCDLDQIKEHWIPIISEHQVMIQSVECHGREDNRVVPVTAEQLESVQGSCIDVEPTLEQEYFAHVMESIEFQLPKDWEEGLILY